MDRIDPLPPEIELAQLLQRCAAHDSAAFRTLYDKTSPILFARLLRMLRRRSVAEEALQEVYVRIWERAAQYEVHRGRALAWMVTIARYCAIDLMRRERLTLVGDDALAEMPDESTAEPGDFEKPNNFDDCIGQLPREHAPLPDAGLRRRPLARRDRATHAEPAGQRQELDPPRTASVSRIACPGRGRPHESAAIASWSTASRRNTCSARCAAVRAGVSSAGWCRRRSVQW